MKTRNQRNGHTSKLGNDTPNMEERCALVRSSFGANSLAAGPPSVPKSLNLIRIPEKHSSDFVR